MDITKQIEIIRKRNEELTKNLEDARFEKEFNEKLNMEGYRRAKDLINELEEIKKAWAYALLDLNDKREKYSVLINELQEIKKVMIGRVFKIHLYQRILNKFRKK